MEAVMTLSAHRSQVVTGDFIEVDKVPQMVDGIGPKLQLLSAPPTLTLALL